MKAKPCNSQSVNLLSITIFLVWLTCVLSSSLPVEKNDSLIKESSSNTEGLVFPDDPKLNSQSYVGNKAGWPKHTKKPIFAGKSKMKGVNEHVSQGELRDSYRKPAAVEKLSPGDIEKDSTLIAPHLDSPRQNKTKVLLTCANDDEEMQQVCENFCTEVKSFDLGFCSADQQTCVCAMEGGDLTTLRVKLFKPLWQENSELMEENLTVEDETEEEAYLSREEFACDQTDDAERVCSAFCFQFRELNVSKCSEDGKACLCYSTEEQMTQIGENVDMEDGSRSGRHLEDIEIFLGLSPPKKEKKPVFVKGRIPLVPPPPPPPHPSMIRSCNYHSCIHECPGYCQSMCMHSTDCFCSCPEDLFYTYEEYPYWG